LKGGHSIPNLAIVNTWRKKEEKADQSATDLAKKTQDPVSDQIIDKNICFSFAVLLMVNKI